MLADHFTSGSTALTLPVSERSYENTEEDNTRDVRAASGQETNVRHSNMPSTPSHRTRPFPEPSPRDPPAGVSMPESTSSSDP